MTPTKTATEAVSTLAGMEVDGVARFAQLRVKCSHPAFHRLGYPRFDPAISCECSYCEEVRDCPGWLPVSLEKASTELRKLDDFLEWVVQQMKYTKPSLDSLRGLAQSLGDDERVVKMGLAWAREI